MLSELSEEMELTKSSFLNVIQTTIQSVFSISVLLVEFRFCVSHSLILFCAAVIFTLNSSKLSQYSTVLYNIVHHGCTELKC